MLLSAVVSVLWSASFYRSWRLQSFVAWLSQMISRYFADSSVQVGAVLISLVALTFGHLPVHLGRVRTSKQAVYNKTKREETNEDNMQNNRMTFATHTCLDRSCGLEYTLKSKPGAYQQPYQQPSSNYHNHPSTASGGTSWVTIILLGMAGYFFYKTCFRGAGN